MLNRLGTISDPQQRLQDLSQTWRDQDGAEPSCVFVQFEYEHTPHYLADSAPILLSVIWYQDRKRTLVSITDNLVCTLTPTASDDLRQFELWVEQFQLPYLHLNEAWPLEQLAIPKPWGAELWYTGIEERGVCQTNNIPLPWLLECIPRNFSGSANSTPPLLLKILAPLAHESLGDLYFELHDKKIEVYIVTHVDTDVWPQGVGKIRYGFNQTKRQEFQDDQGFKSAYLEAVENYRNCRSKIDEFIDSLIENESLSEDEVEPDRSKLLVSIPDALHRLEAELRKEMNSFTYLKDIQVGDVVTVAPFFPHSLQHGVRVIEFQTASYERYILSFGQKVLTQDHWDTKQALAWASLDLPNEVLRLTEEVSSGVTVEVLADFDAFTAKRVCLEKGSQLHFPPSADYQLVIGVSGQLTLGSQVITSEAGFVLPANQTNLSVIALQDSVVILAQPKPIEDESLKSAFASE